MDDTNPPHVYASINELINKCKTQSSKDMTHSVRLPIDGKILLKYNDFKSFWELYCNSVFKNINVGIMEKVLSTEIPIIIDLDFKYPLLDLNRRYTQSDIKNIIAIYQDVIRETLVVENESELLCVVLEKESPNMKGGEASDGIHMMFPNCVVDCDIQKNIIRPKVVQKIKEAKIFENLNLANDVEKIIDENIPNPNLTWTMYGSKRDKDSQVYKLTMIVNSKLKTVILEDVLKRNDFGKWHEIIDSDFFDKHPLEYYIPMWLSIQGRQGSMKRKQKTQEEIHGISIIKKIKKHKNNLTAKQDKNLIDITEDLSNAEQLLSMLKQNHVDDYSTWYRTGMVLYNISLGKESGLQIWKNWSMGSSKYTDGCCEKNWENMEHNNWGMGSLIYWAKMQNPEKFKAWHDSKLNFFIQQAESGSHYDLAILLKKMFGHKFVCCGIKEKLWLEFRDHRWYEVENGYTLTEHISTDLVRIMSKRRSSYASTDGSDEFAESKMKELSKLIHQLKSNPFKKSIMEECKEIFYNETFKIELNGNPNLMCFTNGVLDMTNAPWIFRDGTPDDCISKCTNIPFPTDLNENSSEVAEAKNFFKKVFVNPRIRTYAMRTFTSLLRGKNVHKQFPILKGGGDNAKSIIIEMLEKMFGDYFIKLNTSIATGKRTQSSGPTPDIESLRGVRVVVIQEPSSAEKFNVGMVKELTGGDSMASRGMYKTKMVNITAMFKLILMCNNLPQIKDNSDTKDQAFFNRTRVISCESTFCTKSHKDYHKVPLDESEQFKQKMFFADPNIRNKFDELIPGFLWLMLQDLNNYINYGMDEPPIEVMEATESYQKSNDIMLEFYNELIEKTDNEDDQLTIYQVYTSFKEWYSLAYPNSKIPPRNTLREDMIKTYGSPDKNIWKNIKLKDIIE